MSIDVRARGRAAQAQNSWRAVKAVDALFDNRGRIKREHRVKGEHVGEGERILYI